MKQTSLLALALLLLVGCSESPTPREPVAAEVALSLSTDWEIIEKPLDEPLTDDEVVSFMELVRLLPGGKPPVLSPVPGSEGQPTSTPEESVLAWRKTVRDALTVDTLIQGWSPRPAVRRVLSEHQVEPRAFTSLMLRMSCALAAEAMGGPRMVAAQRVIADEKVESLVARIHQYEHLRKIAPESLHEALGEAASLAEYLALLASVPPDSQQLVAAHQEELQSILPVASNRSTSLESVENNRITPIRFEEPVQRPAINQRR